MLFYVVMTNHHRNERARCIVRAASLQAAIDRVEEQFPSDWKAYEYQRIDDVHGFREL